MTDSLQIGCNKMEVVGSTPSRDIRFIFAKMYKVYLKDHLGKDFVANFVYVDAINPFVLLYRVNVADLL